MEAGSRFRTMMVKMTLMGFLLLMVSCQSRKEPQVDLGGDWTFRMDPEDKGMQEKWNETTFEEKVKLPGSMVENGKGFDVDLETKWTGTINDRSWFNDKKYEKYRRADNIKIPFWLQPLKHYQGAAWYQKEIEIPQGWEEKVVQLLLERCHWETRVWIDQVELGTQNSLSTPHVYSLPEGLTPGKHRLTIRVDNRIKEVNPGPNSHSVSDHTQSNWNGIVGSIELRAFPKIFVERVQLYPDVLKKEVVAKVFIKNTGAQIKKVCLILEAKAKNSKSTEVPGTMVHEMILEPGENIKSLNYLMGEDPLLWDEFSPNLYELSVTVESPHGEHVYTDCFGMRDFSAQGTQFTINGRPLFLRGTLECAIFPKTGYPPTDVDEWLRIFKTCRRFGLNHMRFHSWCPPKAAFEAADQTGFYLQVECPSWANSGSSIGDGDPIDNYLYQEGERILKSYGNHPSFCLMAYGNEPAGINQGQFLKEWVAYWQKQDSRHLYTTGSGWPVLTQSDFHSTMSPRIQGWGEGLKSIINSQPPRTDYDWSDRIARFKRPVVSHEIGQWCAYPNFKEIEKYTGVLRAKNFEIFKETLEENKMGHLADSFLLASGKLQALCYKADIEAALRTPGFGGFQLLDLHDFPGQGTALVGVLDAFWEEKGYITGEEYRRFCNHTVPLIRLPKRIFSESDTLDAIAEIAHFGPALLKDVQPKWTIKDSEGNVIKEGTLESQNVAIGNGISLGRIKLPLQGFPTPSRLTLFLEVGEYVNQWDIWVFPKAQKQEADPDVLVCQSFNQQAIDHLDKGGKVLLSLKPGSLKPEKGGDIGIGFSSIFWNTSWTGGQKPHTLGVLCDPKHPALAEFPTQYHSNWQWWDAMSHSQALNLDNLTPQLQPIVRVVDDWFTNRRLALLFEAKMGNGKIVVSGVDLLTDRSSRPEATQLLHSITKYMTTEEFNPGQSLTVEEVKAFFAE